MVGIIRDLRWYSDWNGDEVGYDDIPVVGMYYSDALGVHVYIDTETNIVVGVFMNDEEGEGDE